MSDLELVRECALFYELYDEEFKEFIEDCHIESYDPNTEIVTVGETGEDFFVILKGSVNVLIPADMQPVNVATLKSGDFFGELVLIDDLIRNATVVTKEKSSCLVVPVKVFYNFYNKNPKVFSLILLNISKVLITRLKIANEKVAQLI